MFVDTSKVAIKSSSNYSVCVNECVNDFALLWHYRLGHINKNKITRMVRDRLLPDIGKVEYPTCEPCLSGKIIKKPFPKGTRKYVDP